MQNVQNFNDEKEPKLWAIAQKRAAFKKSLLMYFAVITFLWLIWLLTGSPTYSPGIPWPVWPMAGWGLGLLFQYFNAYKFPMENSAEKEYEKLKNQL